MDFASSKKSVQENLNRARNYKTINDELKKYNWAIIHPEMQGGFIQHFEKLRDSSLLTADSIFEVYAEIFLNFQQTAYYIDANIKSCADFEPFSHLVDQSVILCIQRDYAGAINTLIPVIEGVMIKYLKKKKILVSKKIPFYKSFFDDIRKTYSKILHEYYNNDVEKDFHIKYSTEQVLEITKLHLEFINIWLSIIEDYFSNGLYIHAHKKTKDTVNRHALLHGLDSGVVFDFQNYLKIFHCIYYISWSFSLVKEREVLPTLDPAKTFYKWKAFEKIRLISDFSKEIKISIYEKYSAFDKREFQLDYLRKSRYNKLFQQSIEEQLKSVDKEFAKRTAQ